MKNTLLLLLSLTSGVFNAHVSVAQIPPGEYFNVSKHSEGDKMVFFTDHHFQFIMDGIPLGGQGMEHNGMLIASKYTTDTLKSPHQLDLIFYDKNSGKTLTVLKSIYRQTDSFSLELMTGRGNGERPTTFEQDNNNLLQLTLNAPANYINLLRLNEKRQIKGFNPETQRHKNKDGDSVITYLQNNTPIKSSLFQTIDVSSYDSRNNQVKKYSYNSDNKPFINSLGYFKVIRAYDSNNHLIRESFYKNNNDLITYTGKLFPQIDYTYENDKLISIKMFINVDSLKLANPTLIKYFYNSYDDLINAEFYYEDGRQQADSLKIRVVDSTTKWIKTYAKYPLTFEPLVYGDFVSSSRQNGDVKIPDSEEYRFYYEFYLNDTANVKQKFTGFFELDYAFKILNTCVRAELNPKDENGNIPWETLYDDHWYKTFGRKLTDLELKKIKAREEAQYNKTLDELSHVLDSKNNNVTSKKQLREIKKVVKKAKESKK
ncbi:MAG: hypothetical protein K0R51_601 [Cytophagaceae bacterium]|nr:hypothetical protein [Cytophagaceae bacterium]